MFVSQSVYSIDLSHTENITIRGNIFEGGPDLAQHAIRARSPLNYGLCIAGNWAGDSVNPPGGILIDLQDIIGLDITGSNRFSSSDTLMKLDNIGGGKISGNVFDSLGALYLFAGTQSSGLQIAGNYAATAQALYQGPLPTYSYLEGTGYIWDAVAKTVRISGSTTPSLELRDGTNIGRVAFNGGQVEVSNNGGGFSVSPAGNVGLNMVATQKFAINGNLGLFGYDWSIGNDTNLGWGFEGSSAGGRYFVGVVHAAAAQADPSLHGFRVRDFYSGMIGLFIDGNALVTMPGAASIGGGAQVKAILSATAVLDFPSVAAGAQAELTVSAAGAAVGNAVLLGPPAALEAGLVATARVTAADTVTIRLLNVTAAAIDPVSATWRVSVLKY
jgi:hypothetical protein